MASGESPRSGGAGDAFSSLRVPAYRNLWWAGTLAFLSVQMQFLLRGVLAWDLTEREGALGLVYLFFGVSMLIATPLGGVAADRLPNRQVLFVAQGVLCLGATGMGIVIVTDVVQYWMLLISSVLMGTAFGFYGPARTAFSAELVGSDQLGNAITLTMLSMNGTRVFAPSFAGMLAGIALFGVGGAYLVSGAFGFIAMVLLLRCPPGNVPDQPPERSAFGDIVDGVRYVAADPPLRRLVVASFFVVMFGFNYVAFVPALVKDVFDLGDGYVGLLMSASAVGAVVSATWLARRADGPEAYRIMVASGVLFGLSVSVLAASPTFLVAWLITVPIGAAATVYQSLSNTIALMMSAETHRGRVQSLLMLSFAGFGIAALPIGVLAEVVGLRVAMVAMGAVTVATALAYAVADRSEASSEATLARARSSQVERPADVA